MAVQERDPLRHPHPEERPDEPPWEGCTERAGEVFAALARGQRRHLRQKRVVYGHAVCVVAACEAEEPWILVTNARPRQALPLYGARWCVETMFGAFKSRRFDLEATHLKEPERIEKLVAALALALVWAIRVGTWRAQQKALRVKKHGRKAVALFRSATASTSSKSTCSTGTGGRSSLPSNFCRVLRYKPKIRTGVLKCLYYC